MRRLSWRLFLRGFGDIVRHTASAMLDLWRTGSLTGTLWTSLEAVFLTETCQHTGWFLSSTAEMVSVIRSCFPCPPWPRWQEPRLPETISRARLGTETQRRERP